MDLSAAERKKENTWALLHKHFLAKREIHVPEELAKGHYERLTDEELNDHFHDIQCERARRGLE